MSDQDTIDNLSTQLRITEDALRTAELEFERRARHINRLKVWASQDPTGPLEKDGIQRWVLNEINGALGLTCEPQEWNPEFPPALDI